MLPKPYKVCFISDIHFFHDRTPTEKILEEMETLFPDNAETASFDTIYFAGDVYDKLLSYYRHETMMVEKFFIKLFKMAKRNNQQIRFLEGTPSHDWNQTEHLIHLNESGIHADVKYFKDLDIEYNDKWNIHVLYVPDEEDHYTEDTLLKVKKKMMEMGLEKVDLSIMHGAFDIQVPEIYKGPTHSSEEYLKLTRYYISIGHIHTPSITDRIIAQGSFSRLKHDEEEDKGMVVAKLYPDGTMECKRVINHNATIYKTIDVRGLEIEQVLSKVRESTEGFPMASHVRIRANKGDPILIEKNYQCLFQENTGFIWSKPKVDDPLAKEDPILASIENDVPYNYQPITLDKENIAPKLEERLLRTYSVEETAKLIDLFKKVI